MRPLGADPGRTIDPGHGRAASGHRITAASPPQYCTPDKESICKCVDGRLKRRQFEQFELAIVSNSAHHQAVGLSRYAPQATYTEIAIDAIATPAPGAPRNRRPKNGSVQ